MKTPRIFISYSPHEWLEFENPKQKYAALVDKLREQGFDVVNPKLQLTKYDGLSKGKLNRKITLELRRNVDLVYNYMPSYQQRYAYVHRRVARELGIPVYKEKKQTEKKFSIEDAVYQDWAKSKGTLPISTLENKYLLTRNRLVSIITERHKRSEVDSIFKRADEQAFREAKEIIRASKIKKTKNGINKQIKPKPK